jgi:hypothetical protein
MARAQSCDSPRARPSLSCATQFELSDQSIIGFFATSDAERARNFVENPPLLIEEPMPFALFYNAHSTTLRVTIVKRSTLPAAEHFAARIETLP